MRRALASMAAGLRGLLAEQCRRAGVDGRRVSAYALVLLVCALLLGLLLLSAWWSAVAALVLWLMQLGWSLGTALLCTVPLHLGAAWLGSVLIQDRLRAPVGPAISPPVATPAPEPGRSAADSNVELATAVINLTQTLVAAFTASRASGGRSPPP